MTVSNKNTLLSHGDMGARDPPTTEPNTIIGVDGRTLIGVDVISLLSVASMVGLLSASRAEPLLQWGRGLLGCGARTADYRADIRCCFDAFAGGRAGTAGGEEIGAGGLRHGWEPG